ncbi:uncharacterized protein M421DRAFT_424484 [Didymella exigua CBS 183.55]|uniref:Uncharacterized protein n=1 Tax=Didymella exigua CBS 183.55 TaxID=1150837 RepID=A0A6A5RB33_9PLEO|nr:uncharacterized protein M421DRAFT_424484 [Didymella exigua CBS 183.55]KAF1924852.1 hypothetical protein M421DRAFT_424484 [Didymella exigua CBS 183.55]
MSRTTPRTRVAYVRTSSTLPSIYGNHQKTRDDHERFLHRYVRQSQSLGINVDTPRHCFHFTIFTKDDRHILDMLLDNFPTPAQPPSDQRRSFMWGVTASDIHLHTSSAYAESADGRKALQQCRDSGFSPTIHGSSDTDCDDRLLDLCDYVIDINYLNDLSGLDWFWNYARPGKPEDNMLSNPKYQLSKHDISRRGLAGRTKFSIWGQNSGCFHGNYEWSCYGCGGKCKRGRCKVNPGPEREVPESYKLPAKGSAEWGGLTANAVIRLWTLQHWPEAPGKWHKGRDAWKSIDTFSGE